MKKNILLISGGNNTEHEISLRSSQYFKSTLEGSKNFKLVEVVIGKDSIPRLMPGNTEISYQELLTDIDFAIPCIHGYPGETGNIQSLFEMYNIPYLGCQPEASIICFNKISTKLWFNALGIPNTPFIFLNSLSEMAKAKQLLQQYGKVFVKASSQGSSVGCYKATSESELIHAVTDAFKYSPWVLVEKMVNARELEISVYQWEQKVVATAPGEIGCPAGFYSYEEKYSGQSHTETIVRANNLNSDTAEQMKKIALHAFTSLKLKHLSRIDFFLTNDGEILLNEINTFPGMTSISMFPKMMEANGHSFKEFLINIISESTH